MISNRRKFHMLVMSITGDNNDTDSTLEKFKEFEIMLDPNGWNKAECTIWEKACDNISDILISTQKMNVHSEQNKNYISTILHNLHPAKDEWWCLYDRSLSFMMPTDRITIIHGIIMQMYCDFVHADNKKSNNENILDILQKESEESQECVVQDINAGRFLKEIDSIIAACSKSNRSDKLVLKKIKDRGIMISREHRSMGDIVKLDKSLTLVIDILYTAYFDTDDHSRKQNIKRLTRNLDIGNIYWWHLYDDTYLDAGILDAQSMESIHSCITSLYASLLIDSLVGIIY